MSEKIFNLSTEVIPNITDSISGRRDGEKYASDNKIIELIKEGNIIVIEIPSDKVKAINDSFWKGFFSGIFKIYKSKKEVMKHFKFLADDFYKISIDKNLTILDSIYNTQRT